MPHIEQLSPHIANLIAAGEVVERPASVVKELLENAIDAGARNVTVELQNGGLTYLRVTDDGCGIAPDELPTAFLRHATSKLRTAADLAAIGTLGFRGEALAAIASVSHLDIFSRQTDAASGATLHLDGGKPLSVEPAGCPEGTSIIVRDLFYNTPARLKFMKQVAPRQPPLRALPRTSRSRTPIFPSVSSRTAGRSCTPRATASPSAPSTPRWAAILPSRWSRSTGATVSSPLTAL